MLLLNLSHRHRHNFISNPFSFKKSQWVFQNQENLPTDIQNEAEANYEEVRAFLMYALQEGARDDVETLLGGLDDEKIIHFIKQEQYFPEEIIELLLSVGETRERIKRRLDGDLDKMFDYFDLPLEDWRKKYQLTGKDVKMKGRASVANMVNRLSAMRRELKPEEIKGIKNMAANIPDQDVTQAILPLAVNNAGIAYALVANQGMSPEQVNQLAEMTLSKIHEDKKWEKVLEELIIHQHYGAMGFEGGQSRIKDEILEKLKARSDLRYVSLLLKEDRAGDSEKADLNVQQSYEKKNELIGMTRAQRRRLAKAVTVAERQNYLDELAFSLSGEMVFDQLAPAFNS